MKTTILTDSAINGISTSNTTPTSLSSNLKEQINQFSISMPTTPNRKETNLNKDLNNKFCHRDGL